METKPLLFGLIGFFLGGLLVSVAATSFDKIEANEVSMTQMTNELKTKKGDAYDKAFLAYMIEHHQSAVDMAKQSNDRAKHDEIKDLSKVIISTQASEIDEMKEWQTKWNYDSTGSDNSHKMH